MLCFEPKLTRGHVGHMAVIVLIVKNRNYWERCMLLPTVGWAESFPLKTFFLILFWRPLLTSWTGQIFPLLSISCPPLSKENFHFPLILS